MTLPSGQYVLRNLARNDILADRVRVAASFWARFLGLMGRPRLEDGEALYLASSSIHMFGMRFSIDALFVGPVSAQGVATVVATRPTLRPWRDMVMPVQHAAGVVELAAGTLARTGTSVGDLVRFDPGSVESPVATEA